MQTHSSPAITAHLINRVASSGMSVSPGMVSSVSQSHAYACTLTSPRRAYECARGAPLEYRRVCGCYVGPHGPEGGPIPSHARASECERARVREGATSSIWASLSSGLMRSAHHLHVLGNAGSSGDLPRTVCASRLSSSWAGKCLAWKMELPRLPVACACGPSACGSAQQWQSQRSSRAGGGAAGPCLRASWARGQELPALPTGHKMAGHAAARVSLQQAKPGEWRARGRHLQHEDIALGHRLEEPLPQFPLHQRPVFG